MSQTTVDALNMIPCEMAGLRLDIGQNKVGLVILENDNEADSVYLTPSWMDFSPKKACACV